MVVQDLHMPDGASATHCRKEILVRRRTAAAGSRLAMERRRTWTTSVCVGDQVRVVDLVLAFLTAHLRTSDSGRSCALYQDVVEEAQEPVNV